MILILVMQRLSVPLTPQQADLFGSKCLSGDSVINSINSTTIDGASVASPAVVANVSYSADQVTYDYSSKLAAFFCFEVQHV